MRPRRWMALAVVLTAALAANAAADDADRSATRRITRAPNASSSDSPSTGTPRAHSAGWSLGGPFLMLLLFAAVGVAWWKGRGVARIPSLPRDAVDVLGRRPLDPRTTLWLVRVGSKAILLGASPAGLTTLTEVTDPLEVDLLAGSSRRSTTSFDAAAEPSSESESESSGTRSRDLSPAAQQFARKLQRSVSPAREGARAA